MRGVKAVHGWHLAIGVGVVLGAATVAWAMGVATLEHETGYLAAVFAPDGSSIVAVRREARALVTGPGWEFFTAPATVRVQRDRFDLLSIRISDRQTTVLESFPPSPLEGDSIQAYHHAIFGSAHAHLQWSDAAHLDYEISVDKHDIPASHRFVIRRTWTPNRADKTTARWQEAPATMSGDEPQRLHGDLEAFVVPGEELMPCGIALLRRDGRVSTLVQTSTCRRKYPSGVPASVLQPLSRRADIERTENVQTTYDALVKRGLDSGMPEIQARLTAIKEMQRLGLYPRSSTLVARRTSCGGGEPIFEIADEQFQVGLFPDIERAIATPGEPVDRSGQYLPYRSYTTSEEINGYIEAGHSTFVVKTRGECWRLTIEK